MAPIPLSRILCAALLLAGMATQARAVDVWSRIDVRTSETLWFTSNLVKRYKILGGEEAKVDKDGVALKPGFAYLLAHPAGSLRFTLSPGETSDQARNKPSLAVECTKAYTQLKSTPYGSYPTLYFTSVAMDPEVFGQWGTRPENGKKTFIAIGVGKGLADWTPNSADQASGGSDHASSEPDPNS